MADFLARARSRCARRLDSGVADTGQAASFCCRTGHSDILAVPPSGRLRSALVGWHSTTNSRPPTR
eukprot:1993676-Alexandrium_andersonii.AAC.1